MPFWVTLAFTVFLLVLVPVYWRRYGPGNFLWFSDVALLLVGAALWLGSGLLASMAALSVLLLEIAWNVDLLVGLATGGHPLGLADYMFDRRLPRWLRALSLFHVPLPPLLLLMVDRFGYDPRALPAQTALAWVVLPATYLLTERAKNVNWVHGPGVRPQKRLPPLVYLALLMIALPLLVYVPTHLLLRHLFPAPAGG